MFIAEEAFRHTWPGHFTSCLKSQWFEEKNSPRLRLLTWASNGHCSRPQNLVHLQAINLPKLPQVRLPCALDSPSLNMIRAPSRGFPGGDNPGHCRLKKLRFGVHFDVGCAVVYHDCLCYCPLQSLKFVRL